MRSIKNDSLRNQISNLYEYEHKKYVDYNNDLLDALKTVNTNYAMYFNGRGLPSEKFLFKNLDDLKNDFSFMYHQKKALAYSGVLSFVTAPGVKAEVNKTIEMIDAELKTRL